MVLQDVIRTLSLSRLHGNDPLCTCLPAVSVLSLGFHFDLRSMQDGAALLINCSAHVTVINMYRFC